MNQQTHDSIDTLDPVPADGLHGVPPTVAAPGIDADLAELIATGRRQGYLTFDQVNDYLPDEAVDPEKIDGLLVALEEKGIDLVDAPPTLASAADVPPATGNAGRPAAVGTGTPQPAPPRLGAATTRAPAHPGNDPIRM